MIRIKEGAKIEGLRPEILIALMVFDRLISPYGVDTVITEGTGGVHMSRSLHYKGLALDIRSKDLSSAQSTEVARTGKSLLGPLFDVILENFATPEQHIHVEYQPK